MLSVWMGIVQTAVLDIADRLLVLPSSTIDGLSVHKINKPHYSL
jgi:hypothetical protein